MMAQDNRRVNLKDLTPEELAAFMDSLGEKPFRARQIMKWLYGTGAGDFEKMTDLSRALRARLAEKSDISRIRRIDTAESEDGTRKLLWELQDGGRVESVLIPERDHFTLCISSQVGCAMGCRFCRTARLGFQRNLTQGEIIDQVFGARDALPEGAALTNLVFMGMGEPLANRENVTKALRLLTEPGLGGFSRRHISLSTVGLVPEIPRLAADITIGLTVSLNAPDDDIRSRLMPVNRKYPMAGLHRALAAFPLPRGRRITIAYVMLAGVNDRLEDAAKLSRYLHGLRVKINLIPFNPWPGSGFGRPSDSRIADFQDFLVEKNYTVMIRKSKGEDVSAACGQLAGGRDGRAGD